MLGCVANDFYLASPSQACAALQSRGHAVPCRVQG
jgi:hypothetical protein